MTPGCHVGATHRINGDVAVRKGSLGCFVLRQDEILFTVAAHMLRSPFQKRPVVSYLGEGKTIEICDDNGIDTALVRQTKGAQGPEITKPPHTHRPFQGVLNPTEHSQGELKVCHAGAATIEKLHGDYLKYDGTIVCSEDKTWLMTGRTSRSGDSGGPVFTESGLLVGFVSEGMDANESDRTVVVLAHWIFEHFGCSLYHWRA